MTAAIMKTTTAPLASLDELAVKINDEHRQAKAAAGTAGVGGARHNE